MTARRRLFLPLAALLLLPAAALGASKEVAELEASLAARRQAIEADRKALNADCGSVPSTDAGKVADCRRRQADVVRRMDEYKADRARLSWLKAGAEPAGKEQEAYEKRRDAWGREQKRLVEERLKEPNGTARALGDALGAGTLSIPLPPPPEKFPPPSGLPGLKPGDIVLVAPDLASVGSEFTRMLDAATSLKMSPASHSVLFLKEVTDANGNTTRLYLDHTLGKGGTVIDEKDFLKLYGERGLYQAALAQPLNSAEADKLWKAAIEFQKREAGKRDERLNQGVIRQHTDPSGYGLLGDDKVCTEADRWALLQTGRKIPDSKSLLKHALGIEYGPADVYADTQNFIVTPLYAPPKAGGR